MEELVDAEKARIFDKLVDTAAADFEQTVPMTQDQLADAKKSGTFTYTLGFGNEKD